MSVTRRKHTVCFKSLNSQFRADRLTELFYCSVCVFVAVYEQWVSVDDTLSLWLPAPAPAPRPPPRVIHCRDYISAVGLVRTDPSKAYACESVGPYLLVVAMRECVQLYSLHQSDTEFVVLETGMEVRLSHGIPYRHYILRGSCSANAISF